MTIAFLPNLAGPDGMLILFAVVFFFGAKKLPELAKGMGEAMREFSKAKNGVGEAPQQEQLPPQH